MSKITIDREVLEQALEWVEAQPEPRMLGAAKIITSLREALTQQSSRHVKESLSTVLEQPQLVPVYQYQLANGFWADQTKERYDYNVRNGWATVRVLYTSLQAAPPKPQPVQPQPELQSVPAGCHQLLTRLEWQEVPHEYRESEYFCPVCERDKKSGHEAGCELAAIAAAPQPQPVAWLVTGPSEKRSFDMQSFAESWCKGLNKGFGEDVYKISNLVVQSSEPHEKCNDERMCAACYSGQGKCKTQPVQQEPCPECDGTGTVAGSQAHFPCPLCTSPQAQPQPVQEPVAAQHRFRHPQKTMPDWSPWQPCKVADRPAWQLDSQGYEVEYRALYTSPQAQGEKQ